MPPEACLHAALDAAAVPVTLWWRDDDAGRDHPRLERLLALAARHAVPVTLAVVPDWLAEPCRARIIASPQATVVQHGIAHRDHAVPPAKKIELGGSADPRALQRDLRQGLQRLADSFGRRFVRALVPPWNRIAAGLVPSLPGLGFHGLSAYGTRRVVAPVPGLIQVNTHVDLVAWRDGGRALRGDEVVEQLVRSIAAGTGEPIGLLSHHLVMDTAAFATLDHVLALMLDHPRVRWAQAGTLFGEG